MIIKGKITYECDDGFYKYYYNDDPIIVVNEEEKEGLRFNDSIQTVISVCETEFRDKIRDVLVEKQFNLIGRPFLNFYGILEFRSQFYCKSDQSKEDFIEINEKIISILKCDRSIFPITKVKVKYLGI